MEKTLVISEENVQNVLSQSIILDKKKSKDLSGFASIDKPWKKYYTKEALEIEVPTGTIYENLCKFNESRMDYTAITYFGKKISYKKLIQRIDDVASAFVKVGVKKGDIVTLMMPNIPENTICIYALNKLGAVANMVDLRAKNDELLYYLEEVQADVIVTTDLFLDNLTNIINQTDVKKVVVTSPADSLPLGIKQLYKIKTRKKRPKMKSNYQLWQEFEEMGKQNPSNVKNSFEENTGICILHTSGTTGKPKGVILTNENFNTMVIQYNYNGFRFKAGEKILNQVPPFLAYNLVMATNLPLASGLNIVMLPDYQPDKFAENIMKYKTEHGIAGPADWENFLHNKKLNKDDRQTSKLAFLKTLGCGSDKFNNDRKQQVNALVARHGCKSKVLEGYGMTEASAAVCTNVPQCDVPKSVGIPLPKMSVCIYDNETEKELTYNQKGEICFCGPTVMKEYYNKDDETQKVLKQHKDGQVWLHSGDIGYITEDGVVYIEGRTKRLIITHQGFNVSPFEIEEIINGIDEVENCCVVATFDDEHNRGSVPAANIVLKDNQEKSEEEILEKIINICNLKLIETHLPRHYILVRELPLTKNGKVDYRTLEESVNSNSEKGYVYKKIMK